MRNLEISADVEKKLQEKHGICIREVEQCFENKAFSSLVDTREEHRTNPPTQWFLARSNQGRLLKVVYIQIGAKVHLKTSYDANTTEISIYTKLCGSV